MERLRSRPVLLGIGAVMALSLLVLLALAWWISGRIYDGAFRVDHEPGAYDVTIDRVSADEIVLRSAEDDDVRVDGVLGLEWDGGYGQIGEIRRIDGEQITRAYAWLGGAPPGDEARIDSFAFPGNPQRAHGIAFEEVAIAGEPGAMPAWFVPGRGQTWAIAVHGKGADRREVLRLLPTLVAFDLPVLAITYRNDVELPATDDARYAYGAEEWRDLEAAVRYALDRGAQDLLLVGYSMGGATVASFLYRSDLAPRVRAVLLDAPALRLADSADLRMSDGGVPGPLHPFMRWFTGVRYGIDWSETDHLAHADAFTAPTLLIHGDADPTVPVTVSRELAERRPDIVTYEEFPGARHVRAWNQARSRYVVIVEAFLERVLPADAGGAAPTGSAGALAAATR